MPRLRGHHLICLHFYDGEGYDEAFIKSLEEVLRRAEVEGVEITSGADDVCGSCFHLKEGKCMQSEGSDDEITEMDTKALGLLGLSDRDRVSWQVLKDSIPGVFPEWYSLYCIECDWRNVCEKNELFERLLNLG